MGWNSRLSVPGAGRKSRTRRIWLAMAVWNGGTSALWLALAAFRMVQYRSPGFAVILATGIFSCLVTGMALRSRQNYARCAEAGTS